MLKSLLKKNLQKLDLKNLKPETFGKIVGLIIFLRLTHYFYLNGLGYLGSVAFPIWSPPEKFEFPSTVQIETKDCRVFLPVEINERKGTFLFDPSRSHSIIDTNFAGAMEGVYGFPSYYGVAFLKTVKVGEILFKDIRLPVGNTQEDDLLDHIDGVIGVDFLIQVKATINLKDRTMIFDAPRSQMHYKPDGRAKVYYSFAKAAPITEILYGGTEFLSTINFSSKKNILKVQTDSRNVWRTKPSFFLMGRSKVQGNPTVIKEDLVSIFKDVKAEMGCPVLKQLDPFTIDLKAESIFYKTTANAKH